MAGFSGGVCPKKNYSGRRGGTVAALRTPSARPLDTPRIFFTEPRGLFRQCPLCAKAAPESYCVLHRVARCLRQCRGLTQSQLAHQLKTSRQQISELERGESLATLGTLRRISRALRVPQGVLLRMAGL